MLDIELMSKQLTHDEYEKGRDLFNILRERGYPINKAAGIVYRAGWLAAKGEAKEDSRRLRAEIGRLHNIINSLRSSQPEATADTQPVEAEEGSIVNE